ncbi:hypothetical protein STIUS_v1c06400 [Spiroplasma sp. TIUS-1]|uniref:hypothetical protein n=1 Tax=Spiroplasma sp. TIUS-1 TaxID=216963 RepID=UPI0013988B1F|nr:hypothetical protein [Spiroplasma sp. TIUS-1]QHX36194.1 hypothetical protein STIUS_v1c06400 [Spiroplasma sp. TIUS-1]
MKLTEAQYKDMSQCLGKNINKDTDFELLSLELQKDMHDMIESLRGLITINKALIKDNQELFDQNEFLLNEIKSENMPSKDRILN